MKQQSPVATEVGRVFHDLEEVAHRVRERAVSELESLESAAGVSAADSAAEAAATASGAEVARAARDIRTELLGEGARGLEKLARDPEADLTPREEFAVEAIILLEGRPALMVHGGDFAAPPPQWSSLEDHRAAIRESIARVGRIEVSGHPNFDWVGTGFMVADGLVMTNRHVAAEFARRGADGWVFASGRGSSIDLLREAGVGDRLEFAVTGIVGIHEADEVDLALLRVEASGDAETGLPSPLPLAATPPDDLVGRAVYVVGYPAWDGRRNEPEPMRRIFLDLYNVKRLQPGMTVESQSPETVLRHDCSTLGGNSGSPVFDLATHQVVGLHYGGRYGIGNYAVPLWSLVDDPLVAGGGLNFEDALAQGA